MQVGAATVAYEGGGGQHLYKRSGVSVEEFIGEVHHAVRKHAGRVGLRYYVYWHSHSCPPSTQGSPVGYELVAAPGYADGVKHQALPPGPSPNISLVFND